MIIEFPSTVISFLNVPCTESYFNKYARSSTSIKSLIATISTSFLSKDSRITKRPILPKPLIPILILLIFFWLFFQRFCLFLLFFFFRFLRFFQRRCRPSILFAAGYYVFFFFLKKLFGL